MRRLILRPGAIGDCIVSLPALEALATADSEIWAPRPVLPLLRAPGVTAVALADTGIDLFGLPGVAPPEQLVSRLSAFDEIVSWYGFRREDFRHALRALGTRAVFLEPLPMDAWADDGYPSAVDFHLAQIERLGHAPARRAPVIDCPPGPREFVVIHPFSGSRKKNWPLERYRELAAQLSVKEEVRWCAGPEDSLAGAVHWDNLYQLACWLQGARLYIGNDSGITHLAAAAGVPTLAIFGPTDPRVWAPRGPRACVVASRVPGLAMSEVRTEDVLAAAIAMLAQGE